MKYNNSIKFSFWKTIPTIFLLLFMFLFYWYFLSVPERPFISQNDQLAAVKINQTSITIIGLSINSSDAFAAIGLWENGTRVSHFSRIQSELADANLTVATLSPGKWYTVELVSVFGTSTNCGGGTVIDSELVSVNICTGKQDSLKSIILAFLSIFSFLAQQFYNVV